MKSENYVELHWIATKKRTKSSTITFTSKYLIKNTFQTLRLLQVLSINMKKIWIIVYAIMINLLVSFILSFKSYIVFLLIDPCLQLNDFDYLYNYFIFNFLEKNNKLLLMPQWEREICAHLSRKWFISNHLVLDRFQSKDGTSRLL